MTNTIQELWFGNVAPVNKLGIDNQKMQHLLYLEERCLEKLNKSLNQEAKEDFKKYFDYVNNYNLESVAQAFCDGFSLGSKLTAEALINAEKLI